MWLATQHNNLKRGADMAEGQELGPKATYIYTTDSNDQYVITRDNDLSLPSITGLVLYTEGAPDLDTLPRGLKPRGVHWVGVGESNRFIRKFLICGTQDATLYLLKGSAPVTIDGIRGFTTGKRGEMKRLARRSASLPAPNP